MNDDDALQLAIEAIEAHMKTLAIDADLHDIWSGPQPHELIIEDYRTPRRVAAAKKRAQYRRAIVALQQMQSTQTAFGGGEHAPQP